MTMTSRSLTYDATTVPDSPSLPIARNTALLAAALAANTAMLQLSAAVASITLVLVLGRDGLLGLGPAIVLGAGALAAMPAGRSMDRFGRVPVLAAGLGLGGVGIANGATLLARTAGGDMYPPERRARGIALVLFGAVFGAILGPVVFGPVLAGRELDGDSLAALWLAAGAFELVGLALVAAVRPDPKRIAALLRHVPEEPGRTRTAPIGELLRHPGVVPALVAGQASFGVMVAVMTLTGSVVVDHFHQEQHDVFLIIAAHFVGMYALVIVVGDLVDRIGRTRALAGGLIVMGLSVSGLLWVEGAHATAGALFGLGLGWNISFVAATAELTKRTEPWERASLLGFNDLVSGATGAGLTLLGGVALTAGGVAALAIGAVVLVTIPAAWVLLGAPSSQFGNDHPRRRPCA
jgi:MFS family permease